MGFARQWKRAPAKRWNDAGQVSFAVIAVVLLVATTFTGVYLAERELDEAEDGRRAKQFEAMEKVVLDVSREMSLCGAAKAQAIVSGWEEFPVNESRISNAFSEEMWGYVCSAFPRTDGTHRVEVADWTGVLFFLEKSTLDLAPSDNSSQDTIVDEGVEVEYVRLPSPSSEDIGVCEANPYYVAVGNFSVRVSASGLNLTKWCSFDRPVISALPFLESKLRAFETASDGEFSDLGRMVSYMLATLCELRVLQGYGQPMYTGLDTDSILMEEDVYRAVALGLLLEQARLFKTLDESFSDDVEALFGGSALGMAALNGVRPRALDPAELFLWFLGITDPGLDSRMIVAQAVAGVGDLLVLKLMEYLGWLGLIEAAEQWFGLTTESIESLIAYLTGEDRANEAVVSWIETTIESAGRDPDDYSLAFSFSDDYVAVIPEKQYFVEDASGNLYPVWVGNASISTDVPELDLLASDFWADFYPTYKECQGDFRTLLEDGITRFAFDVASVSEVSMDGLAVDPMDGTGLFESLAKGVDEVSVQFDAEAIAEAGSRLPMYSAEYELANRLGEFVSSAELGEEESTGLMDGVYDGLATAVLSTARYAYIPSLAVPVEQQLDEIVRADVENDAAWGVCVEASATVGSLVRIYLDRLAAAVNSSVVRLDDGFSGPLLDAVCGFLLEGADDFPGLAELVEGELACFARELISQRTLGKHKDAVHIDLSGSFQFWDGDLEKALDGGNVVTESVSLEVDPLPPLEIVPYDEESGYSSLGSLFPTDSLLVQVKRPWDYDRSRAEYPNVHMTSLSNSTLTPYATQWLVSVVGCIGLRANSDNPVFGSLATGGVASSSTLVKICLCVPVVVHSGWALQGVEYNPSNTMLGDTLQAAKAFSSMVWEKLEPVVGWVVDALERVYRFVSEAFEAFAKFATRVIKAISSAFQTLVENLQEFVQKLADSVLGKAVKAFIDIYGRVELRITLHGFLIVIQTDIPDLLYRQGNDLLRITVSTDRFGPSIAFGVRVARLSDGTFDVLANGTVVLRKATVDVLVDPLMHILRRFVEVHCRAETWAMDITMPEVEPYESLSVSTSDIPGVGAILSNIPIPMLGLSASVEAGMQLKYSPPFPTDLVINEFESNPEGEDAGREWVEVYNPLDKVRCVDGWSIATVHGRNSAIMIKGTLPPNGLLVFGFPETSIDNGNPDDPFNDGDAVVLIDPAGVVVDISPVMRDTSNDERTVQRNWDGGPRWVFKQGSRGGSNGIPVLLASADFIAKALFQAFKDAFVETQLQEVTASLEFVVLFAKRVLHHFIENLLAIVKEIIHEIDFYIEVILSEATGSAGVGLRTSFVITGEAIVDLVRWLIHSVATFIVNLGRPSCPIAYPTFPKEFFSGLYISFEVLFEVGLPKMTRLLGAVGGFDLRYDLAVVVSPNIPAIGKLVGRSWGNWTVEFGVCLEGIPRECVAGFLAKDTGKLVDLWLIKGRAYGL